MLFYIMIIIFFVFNVFKEIALYGEFTIRETMQFFGMVNGMTPEQVEQKLEFLLNFLQLPSASRAVKNLR